MMLNRACPGETMLSAYPFQHLLYDVGLGIPPNGPPSFFLNYEHTQK